MITKYKKKNGQTAYKLSVYLGVDPVTGKEIRTNRQGFKTEREAKRAEVELVRQFENQGAWKNNDAATFDDVAQLWLEQYQHTVKPSTYMNTVAHYRTRVKAVLGDLRINKVSVMQCQKLINSLSSFAGYGNYISLINRIFKYAIHLGIIDTNPMDKTIRAKSTHKPKSDEIDNFYTKEELTAFLELAKDKPEKLLITRLLAFGGLRISEALSLYDSDFDFIEKTISITKTWAYTKEGFVIQEPKTKKSKRTISMDDETITLAKTYIENHKNKKYQDSSLVFNIRSQSFAKWLRHFCAKHNLKPITAHGFRHTHASLLFEAGVPAKVIQERLGHSKIAMTLDLYTHLSKSKSTEAVDKLTDFMAIP